MTPREQLVTVREGATPRRSAGAACTSTASSACWSSTTTFELRGPDHRQGHPEGDRASRTPARTRTASCASAPRSASARAPRSASTRWSRPASTCIVVDTAHGHSQGVLDRVRWVKKQLSAGRRSSAATSPPATARKALVDARRRRRQGRHRPGLDLHHAHRRRRRRAADHARSQNVAEALAGHRRAADRRRRHPLLGRHRQGASPPARTRVMIGGLFAGTEEVAGRDRALPGPLLQVATAAWARSARCSRARPTATSRTPTTNVDKLVPEGIEGRVPYKGSARRDRDPAARGRPARRDGLHRLRHDRRAAHARRVRARSPAPGMREIHVHDVQITKEAPNYRVEMSVSGCSRMHARQDPHPRLRRAVHPADRAPRARSRRLLRDPSLRRRRRRSCATSAPRGIILSGSHESAYEESTRRARRRRCSSSACRCSASATACRPWRSSSAARSRPASVREFGYAEVRARGHTQLLDGIEDFAHRRRPRHARRSG